MYLSDDMTQAELLEAQQEQKLLAHKERRVRRQEDWRRYEHALGNVAKSYHLRSIELGFGR